MMRVPRKFSLLNTFRWLFSDPDWAAAVVRRPRRTDGLVEVPTHGFRALTSFYIMFVSEMNMTMVHVCGSGLI
jgi:hypothetical protein